MKLNADCPACGARITFWTAFRATNPFSFKCTKCNLRLPEDVCRISAPLWSMILSYFCIGAVFAHLKWHYGLGGLVFGALFFILWFAIELSATLSTLYAYQERLNGVRGWLLAFCLLSMVLIPAKTIYDLTWLLAEFNKLPTKTSAQLGVVTTVSLLGLLISILGIYNGISILKRNKHAIKTANIYLVITLLASIAASLSPTIFIPSIQISALLKENASYFSQRLIFSLTWLIYFARSRRVKVTLDG